LTNPDEIAASDWLFGKFSGAVYVSMQMWLTVQPIYGHQCDLVAF
jgi:hypothetical protein